jgi:hypothetical protein
MAFRRDGVALGAHMARIALALPLAALFAGGGCSSSNSPPNVSDTSEDASSSAHDGSFPLYDAGLPLTEADGGSSCAPANVQGYVPSWVPPKTPVAACTTGDLTAYGACLDSGDATSAACTAWSNPGAATTSACRACVADSKETDPAWGPLVDVGSTGAVRQLNVSGCLSIVLHDTGAGCAGSFQALQECESAACADDCRGETSAALAACVDAADNGGCSGYLSPAACIYDAGAAGDVCFGPSQGTFGQKFAAVAAVFCVGTDAGTAPELDAGSSPPTGSDAGGAVADAGAVSEDAQ